MQCIPKDKVLEHHPDTLAVIRKEYNLDKPGMIEDSIKHLKEWVDKQHHFKKKDFSEAYLEIVIYDCKGSLEKAKKQIDRMCTVRTLLPQFFEVRIPKTDFGMLFDVFTPALLPKLTPDHRRVFMVKGNDKVHLYKDFLGYLMYFIKMCDYLKLHDISRGYIAIIDFTEMSIMDYLNNMSPIMLRQSFSIFLEGYGMRMKGIYLYTPSRVVDTLVSLMKQMASPKVADRIHSFKSLDNLPEIVPVDILPVEYGGKEKPLKTLCDEWIEVMSSEENIEYQKVLQQTRTDESYRPKDKFNEEYAGMPGTFRLLTVD